jgi:ATP-binding cassette subfamily C protein LapB
VTTIRLDGGKRSLVRISIEICLSKHKFYSLVVFLLSIGCLVTDFLGIIIFLPIIANVLGQTESASGSGLSIFSVELSEITSFSTLLVGAIAIYVARAVFYFLKNQALYGLRSKVGNELFGQLFTQRISQSYSQITMSPTSLHIRDLGNALSPFDYFVIPTLSIVTSLLLTLLTIAVIIAVSPLAMLGSIFATFGLTFFLYRWVRSRINTLTARHQELEVSRAHLFIQLFEGIREVKTLQLESFFKSSALKENELFLANERSRLSLNQLVPIGLETTLIVALIFSLLFTVEIVNQPLDSSNLGFLALGVIRLIPVTGGILGDLGQINSGSAYFLPILGELAERGTPKLAQPEISGTNEKATSILSDGELIRFQNVAFGFAKSESNLFENVDLSIMEGQTILVTGRNGVGKSTLIDIILNLYTPTEGTISRASELNRRGAIAYVPQFPFFFDGTLGENLTFGGSIPLDDEVDLSRICDDVAQQLGLSVLTQNTDSQIRGRFLSGGQRQRLALVRAQLSNPKLILLDEPFASLDRDSKTDFVQALNANRGTAKLVVTHTVPDALIYDHIYCIEDQQVVSTEIH